MYERGKSDSPVVPAKPPNKPARAGAEAVEERGLAKGNTGQQNALRTQSRDGCAPSALDRVRRVAEQDREARFTALLHHVSVDRLRGGGYVGMSGDAAAGVEGVTWQAYGQQLEATLHDLHDRLQRGGVPGEAVT